MEFNKKRFEQLKAELNKDKVSLTFKNPDNCTGKLKEYHTLRKLAASVGRNEQFARDKATQAQTDKEIEFYRDKTGYVNKATGLVLSQERNADGLAKLIETLLNDSINGKTATDRAKSSRAFLDLTNLKAAYQAPANLESMPIDEIMKSLKSRGYTITKDPEPIDYDSLSEDELAKLVKERGLNEKQV